MSVRDSAAAVPTARTSFAYPQAAAPLTLVLRRCASVLFSLTQSSYQYLVQKLSRDLELLLEHTRSRDAEGRETALNKERTDGCMHIMRQLGQSTAAVAVNSRSPHSALCRPRICTAATSVCMPRDG